jgi:hypothetical protein
MRCRHSELLDWQGHDLVELHRTIARQPLVFRRDFSGLVGELPRRIGKDGREAAALRKADQIERCSALCRSRKIGAMTRHRGGFLRAAG